MHLVYDYNAETKKYEPKSLQDLCIIKVAKHVNCFWDTEKLKLPWFLERDVQEMWKDVQLHCREVIPKEDFNIQWCLENLDVSKTNFNILSKLLSMYKAVKFMSAEDWHDFVFWTHASSSHLTLKLYYFTHLESITHHKKSLRVCYNCAKDINDKAKKVRNSTVGQNSTKKLHVEKQKYHEEFTYDEILSWLVSHTRNWCDICLCALFKYTCENAYEDYCHWESSDDDDVNNDSIIYDWFNNIFCAPPKRNVEGHMADNGDDDS